MVNKRKIQINCFELNCITNCRLFCFLFFFLNPSSSYYDLVGRCTISINDINTKTCSHSLITGQKLHGYSPNQVNRLSNEPTGDGPFSMCDIPLFGTISCKLEAQPYSATQLLKSGFLLIRVGFFC